MQEIYMFLSTWGKGDEMSTSYGVVRTTSEELAKAYALQQGTEAFPGFVNLSHSALLVEMETIPTFG